LRWALIEATLVLMVMAMMNSLKQMNVDKVCLGVGIAKVSMDLVSLVGLHACSVQDCYRAALFFL
jgi:hypothetical protein